MPGKMITGQIAEIPGPQKALIIQSAESVAAMIKRVSRPLFVFGSEALNIKTNDADLINTAIKLSENPKNTIVTTGHMISEFRRRNGDKVYSMQLMNLGDRLRDPDWGGFDGRGPYDLVIFTGYRANKIIGTTLYGFLVSYVCQKILFGNLVRRRQCIPAHLFRANNKQRHKEKRENEA